MRSLFLALGLVLTAGWTSAEEKAFSLPEHPRIAFIGNTFCERDQQQGYLETLLIAGFADKEIEFRNLGWSGDTVRGEARAGFGQPIDGFNHIAKHVAELKPNVIFLNYGLNESYAGEAGLAGFESDLAKLLDMLSKESAKIVIFGIMQQENLGPPLPDPAAQNKNIQLYNAALAKTAAGRGLMFVDLYDVPTEFAKANGGKHFTLNEIHPTPAGHRFAGEAIARKLGLPAGVWDDRLEKIRQLTVEKNRLYFHRWRPENETYILGFRKKEQGRNAVEIPQFDALVAEKEAEINRVKKN
ncbi:MAG: GDSL-like Lipase/Acylhydrolase [Phycisphaerales bacterium]|nr:GDSL-like Lipase/Acylhydrolase [Phycisphaerales bacterium]